MKIFKKYIIKKCLEYLEEYRVEHTLILGSIRDYEGVDDFYEEIESCKNILTKL